MLTPSPGLATATLAFLVGGGLAEELGSGSVRAVVEEEGTSGGTASSNASTSSRSSALGSLLCDFMEGGHRMHGHKRLMLHYIGQTLRDEITTHELPPRSMRS